MDAERDWPVTLAQFKEYDHALKPDKDKATPGGARPGTWGGARGGGGGRGGRK
jgi:hypothetical protein